jgi:hypothetical protein
MSAANAVLMPNWLGDMLLALSVVERKKRAELVSNLDYVHQVLRDGAASAGAR